LQIYRFSLNRFFNIVFLLLLPLTLINGQVNDRNKLIQVSGIIIDAEKNPVPHVSLISRKLRRGTISELSGIYSIISLPGDTIYLSALGFKRMEFFLPVKTDEQQISRDIVLETDTIKIDGVVILPWKTYEEFIRDVLAHQPVMKPEIRNMYNNLALIHSAVENSSNYQVSPEAGYRYSMQLNANALYTRGQYPANNLLNPFAWAKFFSDVKRGLLKNQKTVKTATRNIKIKKKKAARN
jgi:hypothetical protein